MAAYDLILSFWVAVTHLAWSLLGYDAPLNAILVPTPRTHVFTLTKFGSSGFARSSSLVCSHSQTSLPASSLTFLGICLTPNHLGAPRLWTCRVDLYPMVPLRGNECPSFPPPPHSFQHQGLYHLVCVGLKATNRSFLFKTCFRVLFWHLRLGTKAKTKSEEKSLLKKILLEGSGFFCELSSHGVVYNVLMDL